MPLQTYKHKVVKVRDYVELQAVIKSNEEIGYVVAGLTSFLGSSQNLAFIVVFKRKLAHD